MKYIVCVFSVLCLGLLSACGGGGGGSSAPSSPTNLSIYPSDVTLGPGGFQQFRAIASGGGSGSINWSVVPGGGGSSPVGSISASGVYTAPTILPVSEPVVIMAMEGNTTAKANVTVEFSDLSLNGQYVFTFEQFGGTADTEYIGLLTLDGQGNISGIEDVNGAGGVFSAVPVTGNYYIEANGEGTLVINGGSAGTLSLTLDLIEQAEEGLLVDNTPGEVGGGDLDPVSAALTSTAQLSGNYTLTLGSSTLASNDNSAGLLTLSTGSVTSGSMDENDNGNYLQSGTVSGSYAVSGSNRGTLTLTIGAQTRHFVLYAVSPDDVQVMETDPGMLIGGGLDLQSATTINPGAVAGGWLVQLAGSGTGTALDVLLTGATITPTSSTGGNILFWNLFENDNGNCQQVPNLTTTYTLAPDGRGTMTIPTPEGKRSFVFYVQSPNILNMLEASSGFGNVSGSPLGMQEASPGVSPGQYVFLMTQAAPNSSTMSTVQGLLSLNSAGQVTGEENVNAGGVITRRPVTGTLTVNDSTGVYTLTLDLGGGATANYVLLAEANNILAGISSDANEVSVGAMIVQYTTQ